MKRVVVLLLVALPLFAQPWLDAYRRGVAAVKAKNYAAGAEALQAAIREQPAENATYLPHMWLGIARVNLKEFDAALAELRISEAQGVVQTTPFYAQMRNWVKEAQDQKAAEEPRKQANAAIGRAMAAQTEALRAGAERSESYRNAQKRLNDAIELSSHADIDVPAYKQALLFANEAQRMFAAAMEEAKKPKDVVVPFAEVPKPKPPVAQPPVPQPAVVSESLAAARIAVQSYKRKLMDAKMPAIDATLFERQLAGNPDEKTVARIAAQIAEHERRLEEKLKPVEAPPVVVQAAPIIDTRPDLEAAYRAFANGDLAASETLLTSAIAKSATAEAYALRGCTRYTRAMLSRTPDALLPSAADDFRAALRINAALRLDDGAFSPKLVAFFENVRKGM
jgi:hypothetical protein